MTIDIVKPSWSAPKCVRVFNSTRIGGYSQPPFDSMNLGLHVDDDADTVQKNRHYLQQQLRMPGSPLWMNQVHGTDVYRLEDKAPTETIVADAALTTVVNRVITVMTADCLPVAITNESGTQVAVAHAGWRGLANGVLQKTLATFSAAERLYAWLGPAIGPQAFEVGQDVWEAFVSVNPDTGSAFEPIPSTQGSPPKYLANIYQLARDALSQEHRIEISGGECCTFTDKERFYSHRRDNIRSGRMALFAWLEPH